MTKRLLLSPELSFVLRVLAWGATLFALLRAPWVEQRVLIHLAELQGQIGCAITNAPATAVTVDRSCTGSDAMALCLGAIFAFPASWGRRLVGAALGLGLILAVNTLRIGTLAKTADSPTLFGMLHVYVWPVIILAVAAGWVFYWMRSVPGGIVRPRRGDATDARPEQASDAGQEASIPLSAIRFVGLTTLFVALFYAAYPYLLASPLMQSVARLVASLAAGLLSLVGVEVTLNGGILRMASGAWMVTPECVATPLLAVYLAAVASLEMPRARRLLALAAAVPLVLLLGVLRLLVLALPAALVGSQNIAVHAFHQIVVGLALVGWAAWRGRAGSGAGRIFSTALTATGIGAVVALVVGAVDLNRIRPALEPLVSGLHLGHGYVDTQGALAILPGFQFGLLAALWYAASPRPGWQWLWRSGALLVLSQALLIILAGELAMHRGLQMPIVLIRTWALVVPFALAWLAPAAGGSKASGYRAFWHDIGDRFPDLGGAVSTAYYRENEQWLLESFLPPLEGLRIFKTDLWDEARNTRIMQWAAGRGVRAFGADISGPTVVRATRREDGSATGVEGAVGDVRDLPFAEASFDAIYSMGTIEHFDETEQAVGEIFRVLRPGGRAIIGVPNRRDPFLRPLMVAVLYRLGLYSYGFEKSYSHSALHRMCEAAGFEVRAATGILFIPGWLRMLDLACWVWARPLSHLTGLAVKPFAWLYRTFPGLRKHGYLIAVVAERPDPTATEPGAAGRGE